MEFRDSTGRLIKTKSTELLTTSQVWNMKPSTSVQTGLPGMGGSAQSEAFAEFGGQDGKKQMLIDVKPQDKPLEGQAGLI